MMFASKQVIIEAVVCNGRRGRYSEGNDRLPLKSRWFWFFSAQVNNLPAISVIPVLMTFTVLIASSLTTLQAAVDSVAVQQAIDRGVIYLKKSQNARGGWAEYSGQSCGLSSLCTLALLNSGVPAEDPVIQEALDYLREFQPEETYSVALQTLAFCHLGAASDLPRIRRNVKWLISHQQLGDPVSQRGGSWNYGRQRGGGDPSNTQFALLALSAATDLGIEVDSGVFQRSLAYWQVRQSGGGWSYGNSPRLSGSMTCAGIASVVIANQCLDSTGELSIDCCGSSLEQNVVVEEGLEWLGKNFTLQVNPGGDSLTFFYYLYALERVGRLTGRRFIGGHDWYREGAQRLLELQDEFVGFWSGSGAMEQNRDVATSFALLFLSKGKRQVVIGRAKYGPASDEPKWHQHPNSLRQLVRHVERDWGRDLSWQTIDVESAQLQDLLQAPVLILSGSEPLQLSEQAEKQLREYIDQGGCLIFEAEAGDGCGDAEGFQKSISDLCARWFGNLPLERLPPTHPLWTARHRVNPSEIASDFWVYGIQACCRTAVFYFPKTISCRWGYGDHLFRRSIKVDEKEREQRRALLNEINASVQLGENLIAYATGRELKDKLDQRLILKEESSSKIGRSEMRMATLALNAGAEEAQRTVPHAATLVSSAVPIKLIASTQPVGFDEVALRDVPFLWIHGRDDFSLTPDQRQVLRSYVTNGGIVIGASLCGSRDFSKAFRRELGLVFPASPFERVETASDLFDVANGFDIRAVPVRRFDETGKLRKQTQTPELEWMKYDGLAAVFFSPLDLSCALESPNSIQCPGYETDVAAKVAANIVLYCLQQ